MKCSEMKSVIMCSVVPLLSGVRCAFRLGVHFALQLRICTGFRCDETLSMSPKITLTCEYGRKSKPFLRPEQRCAQLYSDVFRIGMSRTFTRSKDASLHVSQMNNTVIDRST